MRNAIAITAKELRIYLTTWTAWILVGAFLELTAFFFYLLIREFQLRRLEYLERRAVGIVEQMNVTELVMAPLMSYIATFFVFLVPILTMRLLAEERRSGTFELLMTVPVRPWEVVFGKYVAAATMMLTMLGASLLFPVSLAVIGTPSGAPAVEWATVFTGYGGLALFGATTVAVGLLTSSVTESQIIAVVLSFSSLLVLMVLGVAGQGQPEPWASLLGYLSLTEHLQPFARGLVRSSDVVFYLTLTVGALLVTYRIVEVSRWR